MRKTILLSFAFLLAASTLAPAVTRLVPSQYPTIQAAIDVASEGDTVLVATGTYYENIHFHGENITLTSANPEDPNIVAATVIDGNNSGSVVTFAGTETVDCLLTGFTITGGQTSSGGGGIKGNGTKASISRCIITENIARSGGGIYHSKGIISNCIITNNYANHIGGGLASCHGSTVTNCIISHNSAKDYGGGSSYSRDITITNCLVTHNSAGKGGGLASPWYAKITNCTIFANTSTIEGAGGLYYGYHSSITNSILWANTPKYLDKYVKYTYNCVQGGASGTDNIDADPQFIDPDNEDYHLQIGSPCIDAGKNSWPVPMPTTDLDGNFRQIDGDNDSIVVVDMGAYEYGTVETPLISAQPKQFEFIAVADAPNPEPQTLSIFNIGLDTLNWQIIEDCSWLQVSPIDGSSSSEIDEVTLTADITDLLPGRYNSDLIVLDDAAGNSPVTILVILIVYSPGELRVPSEFLTIQAAIDAANDGDTIIVAPGTYTGDSNRDLDFLGKAITVRGESSPENCIIDCNGTKTDPHRGFYFHNREGPNSVVSGLTITNGYAEDGGAIYCYRSSPTIINCTIISNSADGCGGIYCRNSSPTITNCKISNNTGSGILLSCSSYPIIANCIITGNHESGIDLYSGSRCHTFSPAIINCTIVGNKTQGIHCGEEFHYGDSNPTFINCIIWDNSSQQIVDNCGTLLVTYCDVQGGWEGQGNIDADPCFAFPGYWADANDPNIVVEPNDPNALWVDGDYHLKSEGWRWNTQRKVWKWDDVTSRCIDAGNPGSPVGEELLSVPVDPNNEWGQNLRINMGAFGGTAEASMAPYDWALLADLTNDGTVDFIDLAHWAGNWLSSGGDQPGDLDRNGIVDIVDFTLFAQDWFAEAAWHK